MIKFKQKENINTKTGTPNLLGKSFSHPRLFTRKEATSFIDAGSHFRVIQSSSQVAGSNELINSEAVIMKTELIKLNSKGLPQPRICNITKHCLYFVTLDKKDVKKVIHLSSLVKTSISPGWDSLVCLHTEEGKDIWLIVSEKIEFIALLKKTKKKLDDKELPMDISSTIEFQVNPNVINKMIIYSPEGKARKDARVIIDWQNEEGVSIPNPMIKSEEDGNLKISPDDDDAEEDTPDSFVKLKTSDLFSKMMNIIPLSSEANHGITLKKIKSGSNRFVFYKWLLETDVEDLVGKYIVRGWQIQGPRPYMEDVMLIDHTLDKNTGDLIVGLFDGHGGRNCAEWLGKNMKDIIDKQYNSKESNGDMKECLIQSFTKANKKLLSDKSIGNSGSTGLVVVFKNGRMHVASTGDCRAVVCREYSEECLTFDHRIKDPRERKRIEKLGGTIKGDRLCVPGGDINLSRSFGDKLFQPYVICDPSYYEYKIRDEDEFVILATDGVWDALPEEAANKLVRQCKDPKEICSLANLRGSKDNLSVIVVFFKESALSTI